MSLLKRQVMTFLIPLSVEAIGTNDLTGRAIVPFYINPQSVTVSEEKLVNKTLTKGGFVIQYWGEDLPRIQVSGTTGSGGIDAIHVLRDVYRHEQTQFKRDIIDRARQFAQEAEAAFLDTSTSTAQAGLGAVIDNVLDGGFSSLTDGISSTIEAITNIFVDNEEIREDVSVSITLAAYAVSIDLYFQGEKFRGYFTDFQVTESAEKAGLFDYTFNFIVLKRTGRRKNFMPWHRESTDASGQPRSASIPTAGPKPEELTFPSETATTQERIVGTRSVSSTFTPTQEALEEDINNVGINRFSQLS